MVNECDGRIFRPLNIIPSLAGPSNRVKGNGAAGFRRAVAEIPA